MAMTEYKIIKTDDQYEQYLERFSELFNLDFTNQPELENEYDLLALLIEDYEKKNFPIDIPSPIDYIKFIMDQKNLTNKDMEKYLGSASKVSEVLNGKRNLSLNMIKKLYNGLGISANILIQDINCVDDDGVNDNIFAKLINHDACYTAPDESAKINTIPIHQNTIESVINSIKKHSDNNYINDTNSCFYN